MWITPRIIDIFILKEFRNVSLLVAMFQICERRKLKPLKGLNLPYLCYRTVQKLGAYWINANWIGSIKHFWHRRVQL